jgi:hypothetical protein
VEGLSSGSRDAVSGIRAMDGGSSQTGAQGKFAAAVAWRKSGEPGRRRGDHSEIDYPVWRITRKTGSKARRAMDTATTTPKRSSAACSSIDVGFFGGQSSLL